MPIVKRSKVKAKYGPILKAGMYVDQPTSVYNDLDSNYHHGRKLGERVPTKFRNEVGIMLVVLQTFSPQLTVVQQIHFTRKIHQS